MLLTLIVKVRLELINVFLQEKKKDNFSSSKTHIEEYIPFYAFVHGTNSKI